MKQPFSRFDPGLLIALALCLFVWTPLLRQPGLPNGNDVLYHTFRAAEYARAWQHGELFPRWAEAFYFGYGSPVFHYYAGFTYTVTSVLITLTGMSALDALRVLITACALIGGGGMYLLARDLTSTSSGQVRGQVAGLIAAVCFAYSPYMLFTEAYSRGAYPELLALSILPLVLWRFARLMDHPRGLNMLWAAGGMALLIVTHNLMALVSAGLIAAWIVWRGTLEMVERIRHSGTETQSENEKTQHEGSKAQRLKGFFLPTPYAQLLTLLLGVGLAGAFWLPVTLEGGAVQLENLIGVAQLDYRNFFVPLADLLALPARYDHGALNGMYHQLSVGVGQWMLAGIAVIGLVLTHRHRDTAQTPLRNFTFFAVASLAMIFLITPLSGWVWERVTQLAYLQFPWRLLGPLAVTLALCAGYNAVWLVPAGSVDRAQTRPYKLARVGLVALILLVPMALALPLLFPPEWMNPQVDTSVAAYHAAEQRGEQRGTTFSNEYLPDTVYVLPGATPRLLDDYADGYPVNRAHLERLPDGASVEVEFNRPQEMVWRVNSDADFTFEALVFAWAGWTATVDDQPVPITPSDQHGLIQFPVPAGEHTVRLVLGSTPARDLGWIVSVISGLAVMGAVFLTRKPHPPTPSPSNGEEEQRPYSLLRTPYSALISWLVMLGLVIGLGRAGGAYVQSPAGEALIAQSQTDYRLGDQIRLLGYDLSGTDFRAGESVRLTLYWYADAPTPYQYDSFVHVGVVGQPPLAQPPGKDNPGGRPTTTWNANGYLRDEYVIALPTGMPAGTYAVMVGLYTYETCAPETCPNGDRLPVFGADDAALGDVVVLTTITVR